MKSVTIALEMCEEQHKALIAVVQAADELVESATSFAKNGGQSYQGFIQSRDSFKSILYKSAENYRYVTFN